MNGPIGYRGRPPRMRMPNCVVRLAAIAFVVVASASCSPALADENALNYPYKITCTTGMVADIVANVAGDKAEVTNIIGQGVDPHLYQATRNDVKKLFTADVVFYSGLMLEGKMTDALVKVARRKKFVYAVTELIDPELLLSPPEFAGHHDPHVWMDPALWKQCTAMVAKSLAEFDPVNADTYQANYDQYAKRLDELDAYARKVLSSIPDEQRVMITAHDAFNYLGRSYRVEVLGIQGISTDSEAGIADINNLVDLLVDRKVKAVFVETSVSDKNVRSLIEGAKAKGHDVTIGGSLFSDAMGAPGTYEGTYIGMIDHNVTVIARALGGSADPGGMSGKLESKE